MEYPLKESSTLGDLIAKIEGSHHAFTRNELNRINELLATIRTSGREIPAGLEHCLQEMEADLLPHLMKEEQVLFPYIIELEQHPETRPNACFGSIANPIRMMGIEHAALKRMLERLRGLTSNYTGVTDEETSRLYATLAGLDSDLVQHIYWEDDVLFPRALQLEKCAIT